MDNQTSIYENAILIVDDEECILTLLKEVLVDDGFKQVYTAKSGVECLNKLNEHGDEIAIILMDIVMPELTGIQTVQHIMNHYKGIVGVIFHTAYSQYQDDSHVLGNEHVLNLDWIVKSPNITELINSIKNNMVHVLERRKNKMSLVEANIVKEINYIKEDIKAISKKIDSISNRIPSFWAEIGKQVIITIILALFVLSIMWFGVSDLIIKLASNM